MNADSLVSWVRDWPNSRLSHRYICVICVYLRSFAAKIASFLITPPQPDATREGPGPARTHPAAKPAPTAPLKPSRTDPLNREPTAKSGSTDPFEPFRTDRLNREPTAKPSATAPPARAHDPAPRPWQSGAGSKVSAAPRPCFLHPIAVGLHGAGGCCDPRRDHNACRLSGETPPWG
jgi:hypothetical protein